MLTLRKGEVRQVGVEFASSVNDSFVISGADFEVVDSKGATVINGSAQVTDKKVLTLFSASEEGEFTVSFKVHIASEIYKPQVSVKVY